MSRPFLSQPYRHGITKYQADNFYINNEEHNIFYDRIDMNNHKIMGLNNGTDDKDAANIGQVRGLINSLIKIEYRRKFGILSDTDTYGRFGVSEGYHVATDVFYYGFIVQYRICVPERPDSNIFVWRDLTQLERTEFPNIFKVTILPDVTDLSYREADQIGTTMIPHKFIINCNPRRLNDNPNLNRYWISYVCYVQS